MNLSYYSPFPTHLLFASLFPFQLLEARELFRAEKRIAPFQQSDIQPLAAVLPSWAAYR